MSYTTYTITVDIPDHELAATRDHPWFSTNPDRHWLPEVKIVARVLGALLDQHPPKPRDPQPGDTVQPRNGGKPRKVVAVENGLVHFGASDNGNVVAPLAEAVFHDNYEVVS